MPVPLVDSLRRKASLPGTGTDPVSMTRIEDVADIVSKMLDVPDGRWPQECRIAGDLLTMNDVTHLAENIMGASSMNR